MFCRKKGKKMKLISFLCSSFLVSLVLLSISSSCIFYDNVGDIMSSSCKFGVEAAGAGTKTYSWMLTKTIYSLTRSKSFSKSFTIPSPTKTGTFHSLTGSKSVPSPTKTGTFHSLTGSKSASKSFTVPSLTRTMTPPPTASITFSRSGSESDSKTDSPTITYSLTHTFTPNITKTKNTKTRSESVSETISDSRTETAELTETSMTQPLTDTETTTLTRSIGSKTGSRSDSETLTASVTKSKNVSLSKTASRSKSNLTQPTLSVTKTKTPSKTESSTMLNTSANATTTTTTLLNTTENATSTTTSTTVMLNTTANLTSTTTTVAQTTTTLATTTAAPTTTLAPTTTVAPTTTAAPTPAPTPVPTPAPAPNVTTKAPAVVAAQRVAEQGSIAVSSTTAASSFGGASPALATLASRVGMIQSIASCEPTLGQPLAFYLSPTGLEIDVGAPAVRFHLGAIVANMCIALGFGVAALLFALFNQLCFGKEGDRKAFGGFTYRALGAARFPGALVFPYIFFLQPFIGSSLTSIVHGNTAAAMIGVIVILLTFGICGFFAIGLTNKQNFLATYRTREEIEQFESDQKKQLQEEGIYKDPEESKSCLEKFSSVYENKIEGVKGWWYDVPVEDEDEDFDERANLPLNKIRHQHDGHKFFLQRYGASFDYYSSKYRWFVLLEIGACMTLGLCDGLVATISCKNVAFILVAVFVIYVIAVFVIRPYATGKDFFFCGIVTALQLAGAIMTAVPEGSMDKDDQIRNIILVSSAALFVGIVQASENLLSNGMHFVAGKLHDSAEEGEEAKKYADAELPEVVENRGDASSPTTDHSVRHSVQIQMNPASFPPPTASAQQQEEPATTSNYPRDDAGMDEL